MFTRCSDLRRKTRDPGLAMVVAAICEERDGKPWL
jgi:hypothetical protein